jgi:hypothetical protein
MWSPASGITRYTDPLGELEHRRERGEEAPAHDRALPDHHHDEQEAGGRAWRLTHVKKPRTNTVAAPRTSLSVHARSVTSGGGSGRGPSPADRCT